jgi:protein associated with RNAse G/E
MRGILMLETFQTITINSRKFDEKIHRSWKADFIEQRDSLLIFHGEFEEEVRHSELGIIRRGTISYEYYWLDRWYNVFKFFEPSGELRNFYCNLNMPPRFKNNVLDYVDLEIDVLVSKNFEVKILDREEFEENSKLFNYSTDLIKKTFDTLDELLKIIEAREFPFS